MEPFQTHFLIFQAGQQGATQSAEEQHQSRRPRENRFEAGSENWQINRRHCQRDSHWQLDASAWNQGALNRRQSRQSTGNNKIARCMHLSFAAAE